MRDAKILELVVCCVYMCRGAGATQAGMIGLRHYMEKERSVNFSL